MTDTHQLTGRRVKMMIWNAQVAIDFCKADCHGDPRYRYKVIEHAVPDSAQVVGVYVTDRARALNGVAIVIESPSFDVHKGSDQEIPELHATMFNKIALPTDRKQLATEWVRTVLQPLVEDSDSISGYLPGDATIDAVLQLLATALGE